MALQKRRMGRSRIHHRRSAWSRNAGKRPLVNNCPNCGAPRIPHRVCLKCGQYNNQVIFEVQQAEDEE